MGQQSKENALLKLNIKDEYKDDAASLAERLVSSECDFKQALNQVIAKYPQFVTTTTPKLNLGGSTQGMIHNTQKTVTLLFPVLKMIS